MKCQNCNSEDTVPVWEDEPITILGKTKGKPDYIGCLDCHEMEKIE